jgi:hypothetical protein
MTTEQFAYWLQGYAELNEAPPSAEQWQAIRDHLALVFVKVTPPMPSEASSPIDWTWDFVHPPEPEVKRTRHRERRAYCAVTTKLC